MITAKIAAIFAAIAALFAGLFGLSRANQKAKTRKVEVESRDVVLKRLEEEKHEVEDAIRRRHSDKPR